MRHRIKASSQHIISRSSLLILRLRLIYLRSFDMIMIYIQLFSNQHINFISHLDLINSVYQTHYVFTIINYFINSVINMFIYGFITVSYLFSARNIILQVLKTYILSVFQKLCIKTLLSLFSKRCQGYVIA